MKAFRKVILSEKGQSLVELGLSLPLLFLLVLGGIEFSNMIDAHLVLVHLTREGANMTSRGTPADVGGPNYGAPDDALDVIVVSSAPVVTPGNLSQWTIIHSRIGPGPNDDEYIVLEQITRGALGEPSQIGSKDETPNLPNIDNIGTGQELHAVEVYYQYDTITPVGNFLGFLVADNFFYERAVF